MTTFPEVLGEIASEQPYRLLFATISGAHLYGFPSPDSDYDLRGVHVLPIEACVGLWEKDLTLQVSEVRSGCEMDLVTHDAKKFFTLLLRPNGYGLEQLLSPFVISTSPEHDELRSLARGCITRHHAHHYMGFAQSQWRLFAKESPPRVKPLLYVYRVLLTGIHMMQTGETEANLVILNDKFKLPFVPELIERKVTGKETSILECAEVEFHQRHYELLLGQLEGAFQASSLPEKPTTGPALDDLLIRLRLAGR